MITTADWFAYIDSLGPANPDSLKARIVGAGADAKRAEWLVKNLWRRSAATWLRRASALLAVLTGWFAYRWWFELADTDVTATFLLITVPLTLLVAGGVEDTPPDLFAFRAVPKELQTPRRNVRGIRWEIGHQLGSVFLAVVITAACLQASRIRDRVLLHKYGTETTGRITGLFTTKSRNGTRSFHVRYEFGPGNGTTTVNEIRFRPLRNGDPIPVTYLPSQPRINLAEAKADLLSPDFRGDPGGLASLVGLAVLIVSWIVITRIRASRRHALAESGVATVAVIVRVTSHKVDYMFHDGNRRAVTGTYTFRESGPHGDLSAYIARRITKKNFDLWEPATVGRPLVVLYDANKPSRSVPLGALGDLRFG